MAKNTIPILHCKQKMKLEIIWFWDLTPSSKTYRILNCLLSYDSDPSCVSDPHSFHRGWLDPSVPSPLSASLHFLKIYFCFKNHSDKQEERNRGTIHHSEITPVTCGGYLSQLFYCGHPCTKIFLASFFLSNCSREILKQLGTYISLNLYFHHL